MAGDFILARFHPFHVYLHRLADGDAVFRAASRQVRRVGARHQRFRRDTARVNAGAAKAIALDHGYFHPGLRETRCQSRSRLPRTDHNCVETRSHSLLLSSARPSSPPSAYCWSL